MICEGAFAGAAGGDGLWLCDEPSPGVAGCVKDVLAGVEDAGESQVWRRDCQTFSTGFSSGAREGSKIIVMFFGTARAGVVCHPARSSSRTAWAPLAPACERSRPSGVASRPCWRRVAPGRHRCRGPDRSRRRGRRSRSAGRPAGGAAFRAWPTGARDRSSGRCGPRPGTRSRSACGLRWGPDGRSACREVFLNASIVR